MAWHSTQRGAHAPKQCPPCRPNEFFANNWVYEGLVSYGPNGALEPALATSWEVAVGKDGAETVRFTLRQGVKFHDGADWNCAVAKLNFDHFFAMPLRSPDWHGWYGLPGAVADWSCDNEVFVLRAKKPYYPLLQELSYIRPTRMLSPDAFVNGITTSPITDNSCPTGWGTVTDSTGEFPGELNCSGTLAVSGTGPFKFVSRVKSSDGSKDDHAVFAANADYWDGVPDIDFLHIKRYDTAADVKAALVSGELDAVLGAGVLAPKDVAAFQ